MTPPLLVLGVSRSGTTMLRVMLDRSSVLAIPDESFFIPLLARRHRGPVDARAFLDDVSRVTALPRWQLPLADVAERINDGMTPGEAIAAIFSAYAARHGKIRWGDKTPLYMRHLDVLERLFPDARYLHLIRDGRDAAVSFLAMPAGVSAWTLALPRSAADFAAEWRSQVRAARALGRRVGATRYREVRYESLVAEPAAELERICSFAEIPYEEGMLGYSETVDVSEKPHQQRLLTPPTPGARDWRSEFDARDVRAFEDVAGDLLAELGYEVAGESAPSLSGRARRVLYGLRVHAWEAGSAAFQRSPLWRRRHRPRA